MTLALDTAALSAVLGAVAGLGVPALIARIPEPDPPVDPPVSPPVGPPVDPPADRPADPFAESAATPGAGSPSERSGSVPVSTPVAAPVAAQHAPKEPYAVIAATPGLAWKAALASAVAAGLVGGAVGWQWSVVPLLALVPVGVALAVVDWRTRLLPTSVIAPSYAVVGLLAVAAAGLDGAWSDLVRALWGLVLARGTFWLLWLIYPRGMGYGDVRLAGLLGLALGLLGWGQLAIGVYAGFLIGGISGIALSAARVVDRGAYPFGPFMLVGALTGVLWGGPLADAYLGRL